jgi:hypothetical protein
MSEYINNPLGTAPMPTYSVGDRVRLSGRLSDKKTGTPTDSDEVFAWVESPTGVQTDYQYGVNLEVVKTEAGRYYFDFNLDEIGIWKYGFYSTGTSRAASVDGKLLVERTRRLATQQQI